MNRLWVFGALVVLAASSSAQLTVADRFDAVHSACRALGEAGELTDDVADLCNRVVVARNERRVAELERVLSMLELRLSLDAKFFEPIIFELDRPASDAVRISPVFLIENRDFLFVDPETFDEVAFFFAHRDDTAPVIFAVRPTSVISSNPRVGPPAGWDDYKLAISRLENTIRYFKRDARIAIPGISVERPDWQVWLWYAAAAYPDLPRVLNGVPDERLHHSEKIPFGDDWYFRLAHRPESRLSATGVMDLLHRLSFLDASRIGLIFADTFPGLEILIPAIRNFGASIEIESYRQSDIVMLRQDTRAIVGNRGRSVVQARITRASDAETVVSTRLVFMKDNGEIHEIEREGRLPYSVPILPGGVTFLEVE